jgi:protein subunit release factor B
MTTLVITPGAGGKDAYDWASMLCWMYVRWAEMNECKAWRTFLDDGSRELRLEGPALAVASLAEEVGVHRLVRKSPFDPVGRRQTAFAEVKMEGEESRVMNGPVRNYVLDPYKLVTDEVTGRETTRVQEVLDGKLDLIRKPFGGVVAPPPPEDLVSIPRRLAELAVVLLSNSLRGMPTIEAEAREQLLLAMKKALVI